VDNDSHRHAPRVTAVVLPTTVPTSTT
jgi:hypothetical protein